MQPEKSLFARNSGELAKKKPLAGLFSYTAKPYQAD